MTSKVNLKIILLTFFLSSCAYFNTLYNAEQHFESAERIRIEHIGKTLPPDAVVEYGIVLEKSSKVINDFPESSFVDDARLLKGKSHYFRREYDSAENIFENLRSDELFVEESIYWLALCKWKDFKVQPAINDLNSLLDLKIDQDLKSRIYLSLGEIYLELDNSAQSLEYLSLGAELAKTREIRELIYFQIAEIAYDNDNFSEAIDAYNQVILNTASASTTREINLKIIKSNREQGNLKEAKSKIEDLLVDETYQDLTSDLEFELMKIELELGNREYALENLDQIGQANPNTVIAIESFFILSQESLKESELDFDKIIFFSNQALKQNINHPFKPLLRNRIDSLEQINKIIKSKKNQLDDSELFKIGELLAFNLNAKEQSLIYFKQILNDFSNSDFVPPANYFLYNYFRETNSDDAEIYKQFLLEKYPNSDYAFTIINNEEIPIEHRSSQLLSQAENELLDNNIETSIQIYKEILDIDSMSSFSAIAALFLGNYYDNISDLDSASEYYSWLLKNHLGSKQAEFASNRLKIINAE